jgi:hypothetical protein
MLDFAQLAAVDAANSTAADGAGSAPAVIAE